MLLLFHLLLLLPAVIILCKKREPMQRAQGQKNSPAKKNVKKSAVTSPKKTKTDVKSPEKSTESEKAVELTELLLILQSKKYRSRRVGSFVSQDRAEDGWNEKQTLDDFQLMDQATSIWKIKKEFDQLDTATLSPEDYRKQVNNDYETIHKLCHICPNPVKTKTKYETCPVCLAYIEWSGGQYKHSYKDSRYPDEIREKLENEFYDFGGQLPLCVENPYWSGAREGIKKEYRRTKKSRMEKMAKDKFNKDPQPTPSPAEAPKSQDEARSETADELSIEEKAAKIRQTTREFIAWFNENGLKGKPNPDMAKCEDQKLLNEKKAYGDRIIDGYALAYRLYYQHPCTNLVKKVSEDDGCPLCSAFFMDFSAEQYEESYKDWRYPEEMRSWIQTNFFVYEGKLPLSVVNPFWPKAKDRIRRARLLGTSTFKTLSFFPPASRLSQEGEVEMPEDSLREFKGQRHKVQRKSEQMKQFSGPAPSGGSKETIATAKIEDQLGSIAKTAKSGETPARSKLTSVVTPTTAKSVTRTGTPTPATTKKSKETQ